jgi:hypothetical protein
MRATGLEPATSCVTAKIPVVNGATMIVFHCGSSRPLSMRTTRITLGRARFFGLSIPTLRHHCQADANGQKHNDFGGLKEAHSAGCMEGLTGVAPMGFLAEACAISGLIPLAIRAV